MTAPKIATSAFYPTSKFRRFLVYTLVTGIIAIILLIPFQGVISVLSSFTPFPLLIKAWKELLLGILSVAAIILLASDRKLFMTLLKSRLVQVLLAFIALHGVLAVFSPHGFTATIAGLLIDTRFVLFFLLVWLVARIYGKLWWYMLRALLLGSFVVISFGLLQQFVLPADILRHLGYSKATISPYLTVDQNPHFVRINSTLRGPNPLGAYILIISSVVSAWLLDMWRKLPYKRRIALIVGLIGLMSVLYATYGRAAIVGLLAAAVTLALLYVPERLRLRMVLVAIAAILLVGGGYLIVKDVPFVSTVIEHKDPNEPGGNDSNVGHLVSLVTGSLEVIRQPFGAGIGSTGSASLLGDSPQIIENQFLFVGHEGGWLGLGLFVAIGAMIFRSLYILRHDWRARAVLASGVGLAVVGLLLPVFGDDTIAYLWWGLVAVILGDSQTTDNGRQ